MPVPRKALALSLSALTALSAATISSTRAQVPADARGAAEYVSVDDATVEWIEFSAVAALIDGNVERMELEIGKTVEKNGVIGHLFQRKAQLTVRKAQLAAESTGAIEKAIAQKDQAVAVVARNERMVRTNPTYVSKEDQEKAIAEFQITKALIKEAKENQALAAAELDLAKNQLDEHTIKAPFAGVITKRLKHPGESVRANEPVVELGNLDKLRVFAFIPLEAAYRVSEGTVVEFQPRIPDKRGGPLPIEQKKFRGVVSFVDPQIQSINETTVRIYADIKNESHELRPGLKGTLTVPLNPPGAPPARISRAGAPEPVVPTSGTNADLPQLPR